MTDEEIATEIANPSRDYTKEVLLNKDDEKLDGWFR